MITDSALIRIATANLKQARTVSRAWRKEARENYRMYAGDQWDAQDEMILKDQNRPKVTFNRVRPIIDLVVGSEVQNRQETAFLPRNEGDGGVSEMYSETARWVRQECDAEDEESEAFQDTCITGVGCSEIRMDYDEEEDGKIVIERFSPLEFYWDPGSSKANMSDSRWRARLRWMDRDEVSNRWPGKKITFSKDALNWRSEDVSEADVVTRNEDYDSEDTAFVERRKNQVQILQYQWCEKEGWLRTQDPSTGEEKELNPEMADEFEKEAPETPVVRQTRKRYYQAFIAGRTVLEKQEIAPTGKRIVPGFTLGVITGMRDEEKGCWFGLMRGMKDPQSWSNKFFSTLQDIFNSNAKGGIVIEKTAAGNIRDLEDRWAKPDGVVIVADGAVSQKKMEVRSAPGYPAALDKLISLSIGAIPDTSGISLEAMGLTGRNQPNVLENTRVKQSLTVLSKLFASLRKYRKEQGRVLLHFIRAYLPEGTLVRITDSEYAKLVHSDEAVRFDVIVDQTPSSPNQKMEVWQSLQELLPVMLKSGIPIPPMLLDYAPLPESVIKKIKEWMEQQAQSPEAQQKQQIQTAQQVADVKSTEADAQAKVMKGQAAVEGVKVNVFEAITKAMNPKVNNAA